MPHLPQPDVFLGDRLLHRGDTGRVPRDGVYNEDRVTGRKVLSIALPHRDEDGALIEVIVSYIEVAWLQAKIDERTHALGNSLTIADVRDGGEPCLIQTECIHSQ